MKIVVGGNSGGQSRERKFKKVSCSQPSRCFPSLSIHEGGCGRVPACVLCSLSVWDQLSLSVLPKLLVTAALRACLPVSSILYCPSGTTQLRTPGFLKPFCLQPVGHRKALWPKGIFSCSNPLRPIFSTQLKARQLLYGQWEGGRWILTGTLLCQPSQAGLT